MNCNMTFRRLSSVNASETDLDENDDEAEKEERRSTSASTQSDSLNVSTSSIEKLSPLEISIQITQCLKLNAENKINDKNAFQLKMIDILSHTLKQHDPSISNLQMASACLDASGKIYGYRVDKVHSDLLKIISTLRREKRNHVDEEENSNARDANGNLIIRPRKRRKRNHHNVISTIEELKGNIETHKRLSVINCQRDVQTSDCLNQASLPQHANQVTLNLDNDVVLDKIEINRYDSSNFLISKIEDFSCRQLCPSYAAFTFLGWSVDHELADTSEANESDGECHYNMDEPIVDDDKDNGMMDERFDRSAENINQDQQPLVDFQEIISNNQNPDVNYEYSYLQDNYSIHLVKPSHWKVHIKKDIRYNGAIRSPKKAKQRKDIELDFTTDKKEDAETRFVCANKPLKLLKNTIRHWSEGHITLPLFMQYDMKRFSSYFNKVVTNGVLNSNGKTENKEETMRDNLDANDNHFLRLSDLPNQYNEDANSTCDEQENEIPDLGMLFPDSQTSIQQPFFGENLVPLPRLTDKIFIPYSQRAKKIDIRQLKKSIWKVLENQETKEFSQLYRILPTILSSSNARSLSPGLAFSLLLHVSHERKLVVKNHSNYADLTIRNCKISEQ